MPVTCIVELFVCAMAFIRSNDYIRVTYVGFTRQWRCLMEMFNHFLFRYICPIESLFTEGFLYSTFDF